MSSITSIVDSSAALPQRARRVLLTGSNGQIGTVLADALRQQPDVAVVVTSDIMHPSTGAVAPFEILDVLDARRLREVIQHHHIDTVYHLSAVLSARGEAVPAKTWAVNVNGLLNVLDAARDGLIRQVFFPARLRCLDPMCPKTPRRMTPCSTPPRSMA